MVPIGVLLVNCQFFKFKRSKLDQPSGTSFLKFLELQRQYGPAVRLGPKTIMVSDKEMITQVLAGDDLKKGDIYDLFKTDNVDNLFSTRDKDIHRHLRRLVSPSFSVKYLNSLEVHFHDTLLVLMDKLVAQIHANEDKPTRIDTWMMWKLMALDIIGATAFGRSFNMIENGTHIVPDIMAAQTKDIAWVANNPNLVWFIKLFIPVRTDPKIVEFMEKIIEERIASGTRRNDILQILLDTKQSSDPNDRLSNIEIMNMAVMFLGAGSDTTSNTLGFAVIELLRRPSTLKRLQDELDMIDLPEDGVFHHQQVKNLPYLNAVIKETLRLDPVAANGIERIADRDVVLAGKLFVPKGTAVISGIYHAHLNEDYWPNARAFEPERWLDDAPVPPATDAYFPFSIGSRGCVGKDMSLFEMRMALATFVRRFNIEAIPDVMEKLVDIRHYLSLTVAEGKTDFLVSIRP
ncbi:cytochrome P450 [Hesseltinella vesiculosa]|uniref:Cytochrome P450 n=1 Tax=Hesseltinella vesiculosa TaxID=101127 RepID=A0A1X2G6E1_9FUNG|nr:cytochrome P450 [Hesseltinella vesiculosa]